MINNLFAVDFKNSISVNHISGLNQKSIFGQNANKLSKFALEMKSKLNKLLLFLLFFLVLGNYLHAEDTTKQTLLSVTIKTMDGKPVNIQDYGRTGKVTVLFFWETHCGASIKGLDNILDMYEDWQSKYKCELVGINMDDSRNSSKVKPLVNGKGWPYTILTDVNKDLSRALSISSCPSILLLDQNGNIVYRHTGFAEGFENELEVQIKSLFH